VSTVATSEESSAAGSPDEDLIRRSVAALNAGDVEGYLAGFSPDAPRWVAGLKTPLTLNDIRANLTLLTEAFDRLHLDEDLLFGARGFVCARWTLRGVHVGDYGGIRRRIATSPWRAARSTPSPAARWSNPGFTAR
jgi:hypothetical protein